MDNANGIMPAVVPNIRQMASTVGLRLREQDAAALSLWTAERARKLSLPNTEQYALLLSEDGPAGRRERELLTVQFTTGESYFFRDEGQMDLLAGTILPQLIARRSRERRLRIWSAGCSAGEEPYSLAMLVDEFAPRLAGWKVLILGTDISSRALEKARRGDYREWSLRGLDAQRKQCYFRQHGDHWRIDQRVRDMVTFRHLDLMRDHFPDPDSGLNDFDLILCRNVFIYLDMHAIGRITTKFAAALADRGYLMTGHSELFGHDTTPLRVHMYAQSAVFQKTVQRRGKASPERALAQAPAVVTLLSDAAIGAQAPRIDLPKAHSPAAATPAEDCERLIESARRHADRGNPEAAAEDCRRAIARSSFDPRPYFLLAQLAQERGEAIEAKVLLNKVIYLDPSFIAAYLELGALHAQAGDNERARRMYETVQMALVKLAPQTVIAPYGESNAAEILAYVERPLSGPAATAAGSATREASMQRSA